MSSHFSFLTQSNALKASKKRFGFLKAIKKRMIILWVKTKKNERKRVNHNESKEK